MKSVAVDGPRSLPSLVVGALVCFVLGTGSGCSNGEDTVRYSAEKKLYKANKTKLEIPRSGESQQKKFIDKAIEEYRGVVEEFGDRIEAVEGLEAIVLEAQMSLAEVQARAGRTLEARDSYQKALELERHSPVHRMEAMYSAASLSEAIEDFENSITLYNQFYEEYLPVDKAPATGQEQIRYLETPLRLSELARRTKNESGHKGWLQKAETLYGALITGSLPPALLKAVRFNLLTTYVQGEKWQKALAHSSELKTYYLEASDQASLRFLDARIYRAQGNTKEASSHCREIYENYPESREASSAMLLDAALYLQTTDIEQAERLYETVLQRYPGQLAVKAEAEWQLATIEEGRDNWAEASLRYKEISNNYPGTTYGFEAPLRLASGNERLGGIEAARAAYQNAIEAYEKVISGRYPTATKLVAEDYVLQVYTRQGQWEEAITHLTTLPQKYPAYKILQANYLAAASICEDELNDKARAAGLLEQCIQLYPAGEAAQEAQERLNRLSSRK